MKVRTRITNGKAVNTGPLMAEMVYRFYTDMLPWVHLPLDEVFECVARLPFRPDPPNGEVLQRPMLTMTMRGNGGDCDDKSIAMASWAYLANIPWRFVAVQRPWMDRIHHVYPELYIGNRWIPADATYSYNSPGIERPIAKKVIIWTHPRLPKS